MTVRPIDMLTMVPRLNEANRQQQADFRPVLVAHTEGAQAQARQDRAKQQVNGKEAAEQAGIRQEEERRRNREGKQQRKNQGAGERAEPKEHLRADSGHRLDVKV